VTATLEPTTTVGDLVKQRPARSRLFERLGLDYCCQGKRPLAEACAEQSVPLEDVLQGLREDDARADEANDADFVDADAMGLTDLANHIEATHHAYLRAELPRLDRLTEKIARVHGQTDPRLRDMRRAFVGLVEELTSHMAKEERILFPIIRAREAGHSSAGAHCGSVSHPIAQMEAEHQAAGDALEIMNRATDGYRPPDHACATYRATLDALAELEQDMHQHIHKENNVLFPKAVALEAGSDAKEVTNAR